MSLRHKLSAFIHKQLACIGFMKQQCRQYCTDLHRRTFIFSNHARYTLIYQTSATYAIVVWNMAPMWVLICIDHIDAASVNSVGKYRTNHDQKCWVVLRFIVYCRIWSWSPMLCGKHGPRDSVDKNRGRRPRFLSLLRPEGHVFHTAWETMIKSYYSTLTDWFFFSFCSQKLEF